MTIYAPFRSMDVAIAKSRNDFGTYVWPEIAGFFPAGRLVPVEGQSDDGTTSARCSRDRLPLCAESRRAVRSVTTNG